ncbi:Putative penicillin-binding protein PbpX [Massilia sp. Bi118]|uniref:serine hydrolase domain-containing protein n=1 Tax=Massilia sp. Bi118 TaxID=2822346 RepID=UPI001D2E4CAF|nr:serine hydrolase [Massilia sp. Bi118]CAH0195237.1 Putative penicillin-binding protein PbpX [Massilia sp. Bi118]
MRHKKIAMMLATAALTIAAGNAPASPLPQPQAAALTRQLQAIVSDPAMPLPGLSVVAIRRGEIVYRRHFGDKRLAIAGAPAQPIDDDTLFKVASVSKFVTTLGAMKLVEQGKLSLDADISDVLGYRLRNPHFPDRLITLRMLLTHTSSLRDEGGFKFEPEVSLKEVLLPGGSHYGKGAMWSADHAPGAWFEYVNFNWGVIATLMEAATGERFDRLMRRLIFDPMGSKAGFYLGDFGPTRVEDVATLYRKRERDGAEAWDPQGPWVAQTDDFDVVAPTAPAWLPEYKPGANGTIFGPQGSLRISTADLAQIMLMLMNGGQSNGKQILAPQTISTMFSRQWTLHPAGANGSANGDGSSYRGLYHAWGLGNQQFTDTSIVKEGHASGDRLVEGGGFKGVGHLGWSWGLNALFVFDPASRDGMIYVSTGVGADPDKQPGTFSSEARFQERITDALYRGAIAPR